MIAFWLLVVGGHHQRTCFARSEIFGIESRPRKEGGGRRKRETGSVTPRKFGARKASDFELASRVVRLLNPSFLHRSTIIPTRHKIEKKRRRKNIHSGLIIRAFLTFGSWHRGTITS